MLTNIWNTVYPIIIAILLFEVIIIVHEGGHYIAARLMKIKVNEFSIGMGPKLLQFTRHDTKFSLRLILFGGYCSMEGEGEESDSEFSFSQKKVWQRFFVVVAGAVMNLILGFIVVAIVVSTSNLIGTTTIVKFDENAVSSSTLQEYDQIKSIDGMRVFSSTDVTTGLTRSPDEEIEMVIVRDGEEKTINVKFNMTEEQGIQYINMDFWLMGVDKTFGNVLKETALQFMSYTRMVFLSVHDLIVGRYGVSDLSGPVGAVGVVSTAVKTNWTAMFRIMVLLTINIGLFNLFPIPALDGWRLFLLAFEGIFKKKLPNKMEWVINAVGLALLLGLMCVVTFSDITKLI